ncbi:ribonuclease H protein [Pyrus ussuriensis x Pyrus communis]|uniref:Ribonuclease H protein n=1 Tax=Pyrus ussuriensis x Pyrus communis TaxID=2448454 RepID=A0A5N5I262_9ROSA|nr:ribonuclease H protein [Pyrus ussuriensis x Pyrus communis]
MVTFFLLPIAFKHLDFYIFFADDTLIFLAATKENCRSLIQLIDHYCLASGQLVDNQKSSVFFGGNVPKVLSRELTDILGIVKVGDPESYLGVLAIWGKSKKCGLAFVKERLLGKIQGWKQSLLSQAGREVLIKAVAQAILAYPMNLFKFPTMLCNEYDAMISQFWWGQLGGKHRIHWVSKERLCRSRAEGGLSFRNFETFNDALLAKQCWQLITERNSLWAKVLKARYFPNCSFLEAKRGGRASWAWSSLLVGRDILLRGAHWQIMNGRKLMSYIAFTCWYIWKTRCNFLFNQQPINPRQVVLAISTSIGAFLDANQSLRTRTIAGTRSLVIPVTWTPPNLGFIKINVEASWEANSSSGFARVVERNHDGHFLGAGTYPVKVGSGKLSLYLCSLLDWESLSMTVAGLGFQDWSTRLRTPWRRSDVGKCAMWFGLTDLHLP